MFAAAVRATAQICELTCALRDSSIRASTASFAAPHVTMARFLRDAGAAGRSFVFNTARAHYHRVPPRQEGLTL